MKFGFRIPSLNKRISARTSPARFLRHNLGMKVPKGYGIFTNPKKAIYNKVYNKTSRGCIVGLIPFFISIFLCSLIIYFTI